MKLLQTKNNQITFKAEIEESLANAIRRYLHQIPILAVDEVEISRNGSPLYDETIAHRIGLIPLKMGKSAGIKTVEELKLSTKKEGIVYSGEFKGKIEVVYDKMPITILNKGQELKLTATIKAGKGSDHSKFAPGLLYYRNVTNLKIDKDCPQEVLEICPQKILKLKNGKIVVEDNVKCDMCEACMKECEKKKKNSIQLIPTKELVITLESFGQITVDEIFKKSVDLLKKDLEKVAKNIK